MRDGQRAKVYDAEQLVRGVFERADEYGHRTVELYGSQLTLPVERRFASVDSIQRYCDAVLDLNWVAARWGHAAGPVQVRARAGAAAAHYEPDGAVLAVPANRTGGDWALRELVVLHELAHHMEPELGDRAAHGPRFCARYVELVDGVVGPEASLLLRTTMLGCGVRLA